eukprot:1181945-Prorocentrum_minimum.AAC.6
MEGMPYALESGVATIKQDVKASFMGADYSGILAEYLIVGTFSAQPVVASAESSCANNGKGALNTAETHLSVNVDCGLATSIIDCGSAATESSSCNNLVSLGILQRSLTDVKLRRLASSSTESRVFLRGIGLGRFNRVWTCEQ